MNCTVCGSDNAPGTRYCGNCGRPLGEQPGTAAPGRGAPVPPAEQPTAPGEYPQQPQQPAPGGEYPPPGDAAPDQYPPQPQQPEPTAPGGYEQYQQPAAGGDYPPPGGEYPPPGYVAPDQYPQPAPGGEYPPPGYAAPGAPGGPGYPPGPSGQMYAGFPPGQPPPQKGKRRGLLIVLALLVVAGLGAGAFIVLTGDDDTGGGLGSQVVLEPVASVRPGGFTDDDSLDLEEIGASVAGVLAGVPALSDDLVASLAGLSTAGTEPGLYGGSQDVQTCDVEGLVTFLTAEENSAKAEAWAGTLGIEVGEIPDYVAGLTAVRLRFDTRVTNHGFREGEANAFQSVLQAGTAVLVDDQGIPRVKCNCGNPLLEPEPVGGDLSDAEQTQALDIQEMAENPQDAWEGLDPARVVSVTPGDEVTVFILVSPEGRLFKRPVGSAGGEDERVEDVDEIGNLCETFGESPTCVETTLGSGDVQATLRWSSSADLDLHVVEPDGTEISYLTPGPTESGGELDEDSNINCVPESGVENVFWPPGGAPTGDYVVSVNGFSVGGDNCGGGDYELTIKISGQEDQVFTGSVAADETDEYPVTFEG